LGKRRVMNSKNNYKMSYREAETKEGKILCEITKREKELAATTILIKHLYITLDLVREIKDKDSDIQKKEEASAVVFSDGLCNAPIREEIHCALEAIYYKIGWEVKPGDQRDELIMAANILNDFLRGKGAQ
jgi:hypothetical protein